ncbi:Chaperone SurA [Gammaproteobacteria bacterium]
MKGFRSFIPAFTIILVLLSHSAAGVGNINHIVAVVDDDVIVRTELDDAIRTITAQLRQKNTELPPATVIERQVLERLVIQHLQLQLAARTGIQVDDETLTSAIRNIADRNHVSLSDFRTILERDGYNFENFRGDIREQLIISRLHQREVANHVTVTDQEADDFLASTRSQENENVPGDGEWKLAQILVAIPEGASPERIQAAREKMDAILARLRAGEDFRTLAMTQSNGRDALEGGDLGWRRMGQIPSLFASVVPGMKKGDLAGPLRSPAGMHVIKLVDYRGQEVGTVAQTRAQHILIRTGENTTDDEARTRLTQLRQRIQGGDSFGELARAHSEDSATASNQGSLGWVNQGDLVPEFEQVMNSLAPNAISGPFKTPFGWHIVQVLERRQQSSNTQDSLRAKAMDAIRTRKTEEELEAWLRRLREEAYVEFRLETDN